MEILYRDDYLIAVNKPHGLLVHRSGIAADVQIVALQQLRDQIGQAVYPAHRLDRKTSGVLLFALQKDLDAPTQLMMRTPDTRKAYLAVVRGFTEAQGTIDYPLKKENGRMQEAITHYRRLGTAEIPFPQGKHPTSRYSLVCVQPETGRMHQIRKHFAHIFHPIIADRPHGCNKQNRFWKETFQLDTMLLHAYSLRFTHPVTEEEIYIEAPLQPEFRRALQILDLAGENCTFAI